MSSCVPVVAAEVHGHAFARPLHHHHVLDRRGLGQRLVHVGLQGHDGAAAVAAVGGDDHLGLGVVHAVAQGLGGEAAEDHAVGGADAGAGQHGHRRLRHHGQVDAHPVALRHPEPLERVREAADLAVELQVGERRAPRPGLALPDDGRLVPAPGWQVPVEAVLREVELPAHEPLREGRLPVEDLVPGLVPGEGLRLLGPEPRGVVDAASIEGLVLGQALDVRVPSEGRRRGKDPALLEDGLDLGHEGS